MPAMRAMPAMISSPVARKTMACPDSDCDDTHVLDRAVGQEPLHLGLCGRIKNSDQCGNGTDHKTTRPGPVVVIGNKIEIEPDDPIDAEIDDHRRQQRRNIGRRHGMCQRQPAIDRHEPRFHGKAKER